MHPAFTWNGQSCLVKAGVIFLLTTLPIFAVLLFGFSVPLWGWIAYLGLVVAPVFGVVMGEMFKRTFGEGAYYQDVGGYRGSLFVVTFLFVVVVLAVKVAQGVIGP